VEGGIGEGRPICTIAHEGLAAVVSSVSGQTPEPTRANLLAHERVNAAVLREHTLIPMSFGTVLRSRADVVALLRCAHDTFTDALAQLQDRIEFGLRVSWDPERAIEAVRDEDEALRRLGAEIAERGADLATRMAYGQRVEAALARRAKECVAAFLAHLHHVCVASRCNPPLGERMIMNAAFLVERGQQAAFDERVQALADDFGELTFHFSGPWPPYNFVTIRLQAPAAG
jgi:hypothetical protein